MTTHETNTINLTRNKQHKMMDMIVKKKLTRNNNFKSILKTSDYGGYPQSPHSMKTNRKTAGSDKAWIDTNGRGKFVSNNVFHSKLAN